MALKVVIAGMGSRGKDWVREVRAAPAYQLAGCSDIDQDILQEAAGALNIPRQSCFLDLQDAIEQTNCGAVIVATPADCHTEACNAALSRRIAVLVEKPFTVNLKDAVAIVSLAERQGVPILVAQNFRYMRAFRTVKRLISDGVLGRIGIVTCQYYAPPHQMAASLAGLQNSVLWGMSVHHLDALRYVLGKEVNGVAAEGFTLPWGKLPPGASLQVLLSFADEIRASYTATYESSGHQFFERGQEFYARFIGERATLHVFQRWLILCENGKLPRLVRRGARKLTEERIILNQFERALVAGVEPDCSGRDNLQTMAVVEACLRSASERCWINPQELLNDYR
jgi:predicted dehydrogenase